MVNPRNGGSPANERRLRNKIILFLLEILIIEMELIEFELNRLQDRVTVQTKNL
jgi:hypothetical protein